MSPRVPCAGCGRASHMLIPMILVLLAAACTAVSADELTSPVLELGNQSNFVVNSKEEKTLECSVTAARPSVDLKWYLGDTDITASSEKHLTHNPEGIKIVSILKRRFLMKDNGTILTCSINHKSLPKPASASVPVIVVSSVQECQSNQDCPVNLECDHVSHSPMDPCRDQCHSTAICSVVNHRLTCVNFTLTKDDTEANEFRMCLKNTRGTSSTNTCEKEKCFVLTNEECDAGYCWKVQDNASNARIVNRIIAILGGTVAFLLVLLITMTLAFFHGHYARYKKSGYAKTENVVKTPDVKETEAAEPTPEPPKRPTRTFKKQNDEESTNSNYIRANAIQPWRVAEMRNAQILLGDVRETFREDA